MKALPPKIVNTPWEVRFKADGECEFAKKESKNGITFSFDEADVLVKAINEAVTKFKDVATIRGGPAPGFKGSVPDPPFEGRG